MPNFTVTNFTINTGTGTQTVAHNLGVTPKAVMFFITQRTVVGSAEESNFASVGITDGTRNYATGWRMAEGDGSSPFAQSRLQAVTSCIAIYAGVRAACTGLDATNITLNVTTGGAARLVTAISFAADAGEVGLTNAKGSTGAQAISLSTFAGATPNVFFAMSTSRDGDAEANNVNSTFGWSDGTTEFCQTLFSENAAGATTNVKQGLYNDRVLYTPQAGNQHIVMGGTPFAANTVNVSYTASANSTDDIIWMALKLGGGFKIVQDSMPTGTGNNSYTGAGFQPEGVISFWNILTSGQLNAQQNSIQAGRGASGATNVASMSTSNLHGVSTTDVAQSYHRDGHVTQVNSANVLLAKAGTITLDSDGYTANWSTAAAAAYQMFNIYFRQAAIPAPASDSRANGRLLLETRKRGSAITHL